jgi:DNA-binding MarR family transcriptional regulator
MNSKYLELSTFCERVHRLFLEFIKQELFNLGINDINSTQAFILLNMREHVVTIGEVMSRGYYVGSNATYNIKKLMANQYIGQTQSPSDRRAVYLSLTEKGLRLCDELEEVLSRYTVNFSPTFGKMAEIDKCLKFIKKLENFWRCILMREI